MKTKIFVILTVAVLSARNMQAQFSLGVRGGFTLTQMSIDMDAKYLKMKPGFQIGVVGVYALSDAFSVQSGILYATQGCKVDAKTNFSHTQLETKGTFNLNYIQIPVHAQYKIDLGGAKLLLQAGPYLGYGLGGKMKLTNLMDGVENKDDIKIKMGSGKDKPYRSFDFGLGAGAGLQFGSLQVALGYQMGFVDLINPKWMEAQPIQVEASKIKNSALSLTLTYLFW